MLRDRCRIWDAQPMQSGFGQFAGSTAKVRRSRHGAHYFERTTGLNVLIDEVEFAPEQWHRAPRYVSIALTNACELRCPFCYAPKRAARLRGGDVLRWAHELDAAGALGLGFGGGEPTAHPELANVCQAIAEETSLAVSMTTHGHRFDAALADQLRGAVHFVRVSVDGLGATYEQIRNRPFDALERKLEIIAGVASFGINCVVTEQTVGELDTCLAWAERVGAEELLLLIEQPVGSRSGLPAAAHDRLVKWVAQARPSIRLAVGAMGAVEEMGLADPFGAEPPLEAHAHVDAAARLRPDAYAELGVEITGSIVEALHELQEEMKQ
jgi:hypothetical protein